MTDPTALRAAVERLGYALIDGEWPVEVRTDDLRLVLDALAEEQKHRLTCNSIPIYVNEDYKEPTDADE